MAAERPHEFALIDTIARRFPNSDLTLGIGDDAALLSVPSGSALVVSSDTLVEGVHFFADVDPADLGYKSLAVNLSDLAAMGATPLAFSLNLTLPRADSTWLNTFLDGLSDCVKAVPIALCGGDTTRGPLNISISIYGHVPPARATRRSGAQVGDRIMVTGELGDAAAALQFLVAAQKPPRALHQRLLRPTPRVAFACAAAAYVHAAIDLSDGLFGDVSHIALASGVGAQLFSAQLPLSEALRHHVSPNQAVRLALSGGDDYELCLCVAPADVDALRAIASSWSVRLTDIGEITAGSGVSVSDAEGQPVPIANSYTHFL